MTLPRLSVTRPIATIMILIGVLILGTIVYPRMPLNLLPEMNYPMMVVVTQYPEASPVEIENQVTRPMEEVVGTTSNVENITSRSYEEMSMIMVEFSWGTDMDFASLELRERVDMVRDKIPNSVESPQVVKADPSMMPVMFISVGCSREDQNLESLEDLISGPVKNRIERIEGVSSVDLSGDGKRQIRVDLLKDEMKNYNISNEEVTSSLQGQNVNVPGGRLIEDDEELLVRSVAEFEDINDLKNTVVGLNMTENMSNELEQNVLLENTRMNPIYLEDVAEIKDIYQTDSIVRLNGEPALGLIIQKKADANTVQVTRAVDQEIKQLEEEYENISIVPTWNQGSFVEEALGIVRNNAIIGGLLACLVLLTFLRNIRSTLIVAISIPASILATFPLAYFSGLTLNIMTLSGLALGIGMLVDNSVVVLENIYRHIEEGSSVKQSAIKGTEEVAAPIIASTLTTIAVFFPVLLLEDLAGRIFRELSFMVIFSLLLSLLTALTIVPVLATYLIVGDVTKVPTMEGLKETYKKSLALLKIKSKIIITSALVLMVLAGLLVPSLGGEFLPPISRTEFTVNVKLPPGTHIDTTEEVVSDVEEYLDRFSEVDSVYSTIGERAREREGAGYTRREPHRGELMVILSEDIQEELTEKIENEFSDHETASVSVQDIDGDLEMGGSSIEVQLSGPDLDVLKEQSSKIASEIGEIDSLSNISRNIRTPRPEVQVRPDRELSMKKGLSPLALSKYIEMNLTGSTTTYFREDGEEIPINVGYFTDGPESVDELRNLNLPKNKDTQVSAPMDPSKQEEQLLQGVAKLEEGPGPSVINRQDGERYVTITADTEQRDVRGAVSEVQNQIAELDLPDGYRIAYTGAYEDMWSSYRELGTALFLSLLLVYMVMAGQFESLKYPLIIMGSIPFSFVGVILMLALLNDTLNIASLMGAIILSGLVVNNAIVLLDYITRRDDAIEGASLRLRPILMTTITTLLALIPMSLAGGPGSEIQNSLAFSLIGGLISATFLTLFLIPLIYQLVSNKT
ncbi:hypothetical protein CDO51_02330 [Natranaerobius trueperi]|uniref:Acriflavin resistance protein n=1 Tax=Natranaerobius trueperi TaxID=759412 RepID=A0A226BZZ0_9FIRM|nr:hypothetical protein CDO51_02330 [Natranaerobius trueperi]